MLTCRAIEIGPLQNETTDRRFQLPLVFAPGVQLLAALRTVALLLLQQMAEALAYKAQRQFSQDLGPVGHDRRGDVSRAVHAATILHTVQAGVHKINEMRFPVAIVQMALLTFEQASSVEIAFDFHCPYPQFLKVYLESIHGNQ